MVGQACAELRISARHLFRSMTSSATISSALCFQPAELAAHYQEVLVPDDPESLLLLIKEIYFKEKGLTAHRKKLGQVDSRYLKVAERLVCEEFAVALQTSPESIKKRLYARMTQ